MEKVYVFGHKNPDTDSVTSAIALSYLKKVQGLNAEPRVLGEITDETKFVLDYFGIKTPKYLNDVKLQIKDVEYYKDFYLNKNCSIEDTYKFISENGVTGVPIVDDDKKFLGLVTAKTMLKNVFNINDNTLFATYKNIIKTLSAEEILCFDDEIKGKVSAVSYKSTTFLETVKLSSDDVLIVGDRHSIIESAVKNKVKLLIISGNGKIKEEHIEIAKENKVNIIRSPYDTFKIVKKISLCNSIFTLLPNGNAYTVLESDYYDEFLEIAKKLGYNNFPVVNKNKICKGLIRLTSSNKKKLKKVILVDHSEKGQSADGIEEAEIKEIIDHHNLGNITTSTPLNFRAMAVGSTNTIIYFIFNENGILIPKSIAGLMLGGIMSDTLCLTSPTTTQIDKEVALRLSDISGVNYEEFSKKMFEKGSNFSKKTIEEIINVDIKSYEWLNKTFKVSQIITASADELLNKKDKILETLNNMKETQNVDFILFYVTDVLKHGSYLFYSLGANNVIEGMYGNNINQGMYINGCVSRKKQIIPLIMEQEEE